jgi:hypothetical protein
MRADQKQVGVSRIRGDRGRRNRLFESNAWVLENF